MQCLTSHTALTKKATFYKEHFVRLWPERRWESVTLPVEGELRPTQQFRASWPSALQRTERIPPLGSCKGVSDVDQISKKESTPKTITSTPVQ